jgi:hypothetical protein
MSRHEPRLSTRPGKSFWVILGIAVVLFVYAMATPWMYEWNWPAALSGRSGHLGATETESTSSLGFPLWAGLFFAGTLGLLGLGVLARQPAPPARRTLLVLAGAALAVGAVGLLAAFLAVADANVAAAESYYGSLSDREKLGLLFGGAEAEPAGGLNNALLALLVGTLPITLMLHPHGPRLLVISGTVLTLAAFALPWRAATALYADRIEYHDYGFWIYAEKFSWQLLLGCVAFILIAAFAFRASGPTQTVLAIGSIVYFLLLYVAALWILGEHQAGEDDPIVAGLADALHVHPRRPVWPEPLSPLMTGTALLLGAVLWNWRATVKARKHGHSHRHDLARR